MTIPQFGDPAPGRNYPDRPAAFAVIVRDGCIACVEVAWRVDGPKIDLPGGGIDPGETAAQAVARECGEEAGLKIQAAERPFLLADQYFINGEGRSNNTRGRFYEAALLGEAAELKIEEDHTLLWLPPLEALKRLDRASHAWAVAAWLRLQR